MTSGDLKTHFFEKLILKALFSYVIYLLSKKIKIWPFFNIFLDLTSDDLWRPQDVLFLKAYIKSAFFMCNLPAFKRDRNLTIFLIFLWIWPLMTSDDLENTFFEKATSNESFWYIICLPQEDFEIGTWDALNLKFDAK